LAAEPPRPLIETSLLLFPGRFAKPSTGAAALARQFATANPLDQNGGVANETADQAGPIQVQNAQVDDHAIAPADGAGVFMAISFRDLVCDTMKKPSLPARRPSAGAVPGR
jgi:hypothetical protein